MKYDYELEGIAKAALASAQDLFSYTEQLAKREGEQRQTALRDMLEFYITESLDYTRQLNE